MAKNDGLRQRVTVKPRFLVFFAVVVLTVFLIANAVQNRRIREIQAQLEEMQLQVLEAYTRNEELQERLEFTKTDEYIEQEARSRFGYMKDGEIRFILEENNP